MRAAATSSRARFSFCLMSLKFPDSSFRTWATERLEESNSRPSATESGPSETNFLSARISKLDSDHCETRGSKVQVLPIESLNSSIRKRSHITRAGAPHESRINAHRSATGGTCKTFGDSKLPRLHKRGVSARRYAVALFLSGDIRQAWRNCEGFRSAVLPKCDGGAPSAARA